MLLWNASNLPKSFYAQAPLTPIWQQHSPAVTGLQWGPQNLLKYSSTKLTGFQPPLSPSVCLWMFVHFFIRSLNVSLLISEVSHLAPCSKLFHIYEKISFIHLLFLRMHIKAQTGIELVQQIYSQHDNDVCLGTSWKSSFAVSFQLNSHGLRIGSQSRLIFATYKQMLKVLYW